MQKRKILDNNFELLVTVIATIQLTYYASYS
jgi:hypothetical protein